MPNDIRADVQDLVESDMVDKHYLITAMLSYMTQEDIREMLNVNEILLLDEIAQGDTNDG